MPSPRPARSVPFARRERAALCDTALALGPDAPTLCGGWTAADLVAHLLVRERHPVGALGILLPALAGATDRAMDRVRRAGFDASVDRLREPGLTPYRLRPVEVLANTTEYVVHHEDLLRAQPGWRPRTLQPVDSDRVWRSATAAGRLLVRAAGVPVVVRRSDRPAAPVTLHGGDDPVVVTGPPLEVALFLFGRDQVRDLSLDGPPDRVAALQAADRGL